MTNDSPTGFSSLFGKLKDAVFEPDVSARANASPAVAAPASVSGVASPVGAPGAVNPMIDGMMQLVLSKATAYTALIEASAPLEAYIADEGTRFKAAFSLVGKQRTVEQIVQAIDLQHMPALEAEVSKFGGQARSQEDQEIKARVARIESLQSSIKNANDAMAQAKASYEHQLQTLASNVNESTAQIAVITKEVRDQQDSIALVQRQFEEAAKVVREHLIQAKAKVLRYLGS